MSKPGAQPQPRLKLVIRRLPPTLPAEIFWNVVAPFVEKSVWRRYVPGKAGDNYGNHPVHSRAYVLMSDPQALVSFHSGFDGHIFRSKAGVEYQAVVEYAPIEKTPHRAKPKVDARQGTIDEDPDFISFMASLGQVEAKPVLEVSAPVAQPTSTPIIDALRASAAKNKNKAAKKKENEKEKKKKEKDEKKDKGTVPKGNSVKAAALASVNSAMSKRAPQDRGTVMVAGKGREVFVAEEAGPSEPKAGDKEKEKRKRNRSKKKKEEGGEETSRDPVREETSADSKRGGKGGRGGRGRGGAAGGGGGDRPDVKAADGAGAGASAGAGPGAGAGGRRGKAPNRGAGAPRGRGRDGLAPSEARIDM